MCQFSASRFVSVSDLTSRANYAEPADLPGAAYRHLMGQKSQSVRANTRQYAGSVVVQQASGMEGRGNQNKLSTHLWNGILMFILCATL